MTAVAGTKWRALALVGVTELFAMVLWFSGSAVAPELTAAWGLSAGEAAWLTNAVQLGFAVGALVGTLAMLRLRGRPEAARLAGGRG